jgi:uncharacterized protein
VKYPTYAPDFAIRINGASLAPEVRSMIAGVRYQDGHNAADRVEVDLANPNLQWLRRHIRGLGFQPFPTSVSLGTAAQAPAIPTRVFDLDNKLELAIGYAQQALEPVFEGDVTGLDVSFPSGGMPSLKLVAHDYLQRLSRGTNAGGFGFLPDYLVAIILSARHKLIAAIEPTVQSLSSVVNAIDLLFKGTGIKQAARGAGETDLDLIKRIAKKYDADFWVDGEVLYVARFIKEYAPRLTLTWGQSLLDFSPRISTVGQVAGVTAKFALREIKTSFAVTMYWDFDREMLGTSIVPGPMAKAGTPKGGPALTIVDRSISSPADIANSALEIVSTLREKLNQRLTGSGSAIGDPRIRAGAVIRLEGLGPDFSGDYRVTSASHTIDGSGYRTQFEVRKEIIP